MNERQSKYQAIIVRDRAGKFMALQVRKRGHEGGFLIGADDKGVARTAQMRMKELERRWVKSGRPGTDIPALMGLVIFTVPDPLCGWLLECLQRLIPKSHRPEKGTRFTKKTVHLAVHLELKQNPELTVEEAQRRVAEKLKLAGHSPNSAGTVQNYWQEIEQTLPLNQRHKRQPKRRHR